MSDAADPQSGHRFRFRFVFLSWCERASERGEAVWACEGEAQRHAGPQNSKMICSGRVCVPSVFAAMRFLFQYESLVYACFLDLLMLVMFSRQATISCYIVQLFGFCCVLDGHY